MKKNNKSKLDIMKNVSILDQVNIHVMQVKPGMFEVAVESLDKEKNVVFDKKALNELNHRIEERVRDLSANDPKTKYFIEEFAAKMVEGLWQNGLVDLENVADAPDDIYADLRKTYK